MVLKPQAGPDLAVRAGAPLQAPGLPRTLLLLLLGLLALALPPLGLLAQLARALAPLAPKAKLALLGLALGHEREDRRCPCWHLISHELKFRSR